MKKLTFSGSCSGKGFSVIKNIEGLSDLSSTIIYDGYYLKLNQVFPYVNNVKWDMGYMVIEGKVHVANEASDYVKKLEGAKEWFLLSKFN